MTASTLLPPQAPGRLPLLGHVASLARDPLAFFKDLRDRGPVVRIGLGTHPVYVVTRPDLVRRLYVADQHLFDKGGPLIDKVRTYAGNGLATCPAHDHARQRPLMQPAFHRDRLRNYTAVVRDALAEIMASWAPGQLVRLEREVHRLTTLVTSRTLISAEMGGPAAVQIANALPDITQGLYWRMLVPGRFFPKLPLPVNRRFDEQTARTKRAVNDVVDHYRRTGIDYGDLLSLVLAACEREPDPRQAVYDQVITILTASVETAASVMVWSMRVLEQFPSIGERVLAEYREVVGSGIPTHDHIADLTYTQCVITEALRLYPPVWLVSRVTTDDIDWSDGRIPAGADVFFSPYALHRDPEVFPDPDRFDPDRWAPDRVTSEQREGFFGFGAGRRKCIGDTLAMNEATVTVAAL
ncbi:MAG TPA: cytochrome P450, partial [Pseudonocardiaceae bacterium]